MFNAKKRAKFANLTRQAGYSMQEVGLVLVLVAIAGVGVVSAFAGNSGSTQSQALGSDLGTLMGKVKGSYAGNYGAITNAKLSTGSFFKNLPSLNDASGTVSTGLGGGTLVVAPGTVTTANDSAKYTITQLPDSACLPLAQMLAKTVTTMTIGANTVKAAGGVPDPSKVTCSGDNTTMVFQVQ
jgi:type II secretory pathway pseudopilin PulG